MGETSTKHMARFWSTNRKEKYHCEDLSVNGQIVLWEILKIQCDVESRGTKQVPVTSRRFWTLMFHKRRRIALLACGEGIWLYGDKPGGLHIRRWMVGSTCQVVLWLIPIKSVLQLLSPCQLDKWILLLLVVLFVSNGKSFPFLAVAPVQIRTSQGHIRLALVSSFFPFLVFSSFYSFPPFLCLYLISFCFI